MQDLQPPDSLLFYFIVRFVSALRWSSRLRRFILSLYILIGCCDLVGRKLKDEWSGGWELQMNTTDDLKSKDII